MLFKMTDRTGKFIQYTSFCVDQADIGTHKFILGCIKHATSIKSVKLTDIITCNCNYYNWRTTELSIQFYANHGVPTFCLTEVLSLKRSKDIKERVSSVIKYGTTGTSTTSDIWYTSTSSTAGTIGYTYTPSFTFTTSIT